MNSVNGIAYIVSGSTSLREDLRELLEKHGLAAVVFGSAAEYLSFIRPELPACIILDLHLPDMDGLRFQQRVAVTHLPIIFVASDPPDLPSSVQALKAGAVDFLAAPVCGPDFLCAVESAIELDQRTTPERIWLAELSTRYARLTPREREVLPLIVSGSLNKQAAQDLGISQNTVQIHRRRVMCKMDARSLPDLVRMADALQVPCSRGRHARSARVEPFRLIAIADGWMT
jgi:FixJ family two-component response regulator